MNNTVEKKFIDLAELLLQMMIEGQEFKVPAEFKMPKEVVFKTALTLQTDYNKGLFKEDSNGALYYSGMTEDYGGFYESIFQDNPITVFKKSLEAFAKAAEELNEAWDGVDGNPVLIKVLTENRVNNKWSFSDNLYYKALDNTKKWAESVAKKL